MKTSKDDYSRPPKCKRCHGSGKIVQSIKYPPYHMEAVSCPECKGKGRKDEMNIKTN